MPSDPRLGLVGSLEVSDGLVVEVELLLLLSVFPARVGFDLTPQTPGFGEAQLSLGGHFGLRQSGMAHQNSQHKAGQEFLWCEG